MQDDTYFAHIQRLDLERQERARQLADAGQSLVMRGTNGNTAEYLISPDLLSFGHWRTTWFRDRVPGGHTEHNTLFDAIIEALRHGQVVVRQGIAR